MMMAEKKTTQKKAELPIHNLNGGQSGSLPVPDCLVLEPADELIAQVARSSRARKRIRRADVKGRAEVRGGGAKPWRQKGTGRARHGSRRSPIWVGGGVTFGPSAKKGQLPRIQRAMSRKAIAGVLAGHVKAGTLEIVKLPDKLPEKTKELVGLIGSAKQILLIVADDNKEILRVARNIQSVSAKVVNEVTVEDILGAKMVWIDEQAVAVIEKRCIKPQVKAVKNN